MIHEIPFEEKQAYYIFKHFKKSKYIEKPDSNYTWMELEINTTYDLIELFSCGILYGIDIQRHTQSINKKKQS
jgi:hypothetical protein